MEFLKKATFIGVSVGVIGGVCAVLVAHALYYAAKADKYSELNETRSARKTEFEGYMMDAGLNGVMEEFKAQ